MWSLLLTSQVKIYSLISRKLKIASFVFESVKHYSRKQLIVINFNHLTENVLAGRSKFCSWSSRDGIATIPSSWESRFYFGSLRLLAGKLGIVRFDFNRQSDIVCYKFSTALHLQPKCKFSLLIHVVVQISPSLHVETMLPVSFSFSPILHQSKLTLSICLFVGIQLKHPSALDTFKQLMRIAKGKRIVVFLDYDGTLSNIVDNPEKAFMTNEVNSQQMRTHNLWKFLFFFSLKLGYNLIRN